MNKLVIPIHSFVDLITNSSSETFISYDESSINAIKELVNSLLKTAGSALTSDDLFDITIEDEKYSSSNDLVVTPKTDSADAMVAAKILSNLSGLMQIDSSYNG